MGRWQILCKIQQMEIILAHQRGVKFFMELPDGWYEPHPTYGCENGHISYAYLKSELRGKLCIECHRPLLLLPPHYREETLAQLFTLWA